MPKVPFLPPAGSTCSSPTSLLGSESTGPQPTPACRSDLVTVRLLMTSALPPLPKVCGLSTHQQAVLRRGVLQFDSVLTLPADSIRSHRLRGWSYKTGPPLPPPLQMPLTIPGYRLEVPTTRSPDSINLLEQLNNLFGFIWRLH